MKSRTTAAILAIFLGGLGIHKFYMGKAIGLVYLLLDVYSCYNSTGGGDLVF